MLLSVLAKSEVHLIMCWGRLYIIECAEVRNRYSFLNTVLSLQRYIDFWTPSRVNVLWYWISKRMGQKEVFSCFDYIVGLITSMLTSSKTHMCSFFFLLDVKDVRRVKAIYMYLEGHTCVLYCRKERKQGVLVVKFIDMLRNSTISR